GVGVVVFGAAGAGDLLDEVLRGDRSGGAAVFVDDERDRHAVRTHPFHDGVAVEAGRHGGYAAGEGADGGGAARRAGHGERVLDVHDAERGVEVAVDDREAGVAGEIGRAHV